MHELLYWALNMSLIASLAGLIVYLLSRIRRVPRRLIALLWALPLLRLWIPVGVGSSASLLSLLPVKTVPTFGDMTMTNSLQWADSYHPITFAEQWVLKVLQVAAVVWLIVAAALLLVLVLVYVATLSEVRHAEHRQGRVYVSSAVTSPSVYGIVRPRILLPPSYPEQDLSYVLLHEEAHIRRGDNLWRLLFAATACVYWFNPLSWLFLKWFTESLETACDESVLARCGEQEKRAYAAALLNSTPHGRLSVSAFGGARIRVRIERILSYKKLSWFAVACLSVFAAFLSWALLTNAT